MKVRSRNLQRICFGLVLLLVTALPGAAAGQTISATKADTLFTDNDGDTKADPGDVLLYTVQVTASGGTADGSFIDGFPDPNVTLVVGSVTTNTGTIVQGNTAGNTNVVVAIGSATAATITFRGQIADPVPQGALQVFNIGAVACSNCGPDGFPTDDPDTPGANDPTITSLDNFATLAASKTATLQDDNDGSGTISPGDKLRYTIAITNTEPTKQGFNLTVLDAIADPSTTLVVGSVTATQGSVTTGNTGGDATVEVAAGTIAGGGTVSVSYDVLIANPAPAFTEQIVNQAAVACSNCAPQAVPTDDPSAPGAQDPTTTALNAEPVVTVTKRDALHVDNDGDQQVSAGDTLRYTVVVTNTGNEDAGGATFQDGIPDTNTALVVGSVATTLGSVITGNTAGDEIVLVELGTLAGGGGSATITFDVTITDCLPPTVNQVVNQGAVGCPNCPVQAIVTDDPDTVDPDDPTVTTVAAAPDVSASKTDALLSDNDGDGVVSPGDTLRYTVVVTNSGDQEAAGVSLIDAQDALTSLVNGSVTAPDGLIVSGNGGEGDVAVVFEVLTCGSKTVMFDVVIADCLPVGVNAVVNQGGVECQTCPTTVIPTDDPDVGGDQDPTVTAVVAAPEMDATKTVSLAIDENGNGEINPGDTLGYTVQVSNTGDQEAGGVVFADTTDAYTELVVGSLSSTKGTLFSGINPGEITVGVDLETMTCDESQTISFQARVKESIVVDVEVANQGTVSGGNFPTLATDDPDTAAEDDPTVSQVEASTPAPVTGTTGLVLLVVLMIAVAAWWLRPETS